MRQLSILGMLVCALGGCDEVVEVRNQAPAATVTSICSEGDRAYFIVDVYDREGEPVDVTIVVDGERAAPGATGDGLFGLVSDRRTPGARHWVEWGRSAESCDSAYPDIAGAGGCRLAPAPLPSPVSGRILASDRDLRSETSFELSVEVGCDAPQ